jgi:hypothetical protein
MAALLLPCVSVIESPLILIFLYDFNSDQLVREMDFLAGAKRVQESPNTLTVLKRIDGLPDNVPNLLPTMLIGKH